MAKLIYATNASLDGYIEDEDGSFDWSTPDDEVHSFYNGLLRGIGTHLLGRRLYETMAVWETDPAIAAESEIAADFAEAWQDSDKVVYSTMLEVPSTKRTRIERRFDPEAVTQLKAAADRDLILGGAELAAHVFAAGLVDEVQLMLAPVSVGGGKRALPEGIRVNLELAEERAFTSGMVLLRYACR